MADEPNMAEPVTRGELHASLETWAKVIVDQQAAEIARQFRASEERMRDFMRACLEPHDGVPERVAKLEELEPRVARLEAKVFAPKRRRVAKRR